MKKQLDDFRAFILRGNLIDLAVAVVIGLAFTAVITALVADLITPLISIPGKIDFSAIKFTINGSTFLLGSFLNALISFVIIAAVLFFLIIKPMNVLMARYKPTPEPPAETKECPYCLSSVPVKATRCAFCTSQLDAAAAQPPDTGIKSSSATKGNANA
ncbi:MAG TPA: large conductance mechanosensitive channel protein MscL [Ktedonobacterales bacterium]|nr:large conductance mechanosensitive channel protein MscL [Ktedonobacterales bacterium]